MEACIWSLCVSKGENDAIVSYFPCLQDTDLLFCRYLLVLQLCVLLTPVLSQNAVGVGIYLQNCAQINILNGLWLGGTSRLRPGPCPWVLERLMYRFLLNSACHDAFLERPGVFVSFASLTPHYCPSYPHGQRQRSTFSITLHKHYLRDCLTSPTMEAIRR